jgi:pimeloyl-ACP methyl ester carboxylesterase
MRTRVWIAATAGVLVALLIGALIWANQAAGPMPEALAALESDAQVTVAADDWLVFRPAGAAPTTGFVFYPGGRVDPRAYAPFARDLAEAGYLVVIVPMPFNLAVLGGDRATDVMAAFPDIAHWAIGGHSLGGAMAARFAHEHPDPIDGLALWAAYPPEQDDLAADAVAVVSVYGTLDGLATPDEIRASAAQLPSSATLVPIEGGNHAQFGWYGEQRGDNPAQISREEQQRLTVEATAALLAGLGGQ